MKIWKNWPLLSK